MKNFTSREAHESVKPHKRAMWDKILNGLDKLKVGGTFEEIAFSINCRTDQVWKRLSELEEQELIFRTGATRFTSTGRRATVWQIRKNRQLALL